MTTRVAPRHRWLRDASAAGALCSLLTVLVPVGHAQSLGDVARRGAERRVQGAAGRAYTNTDLPPSDAPEPAAEPATEPALTSSPALQPAQRSVEANAEAVTRAGAAAPDTPSRGEEAEPANAPGVEPVIVQAREKRDERYWRAKALDLRGRLAAATANVAAKRARLREIAAGPRTAATVREREVIAASLDRLERDARSHDGELTRFLARARIAEVPGEWIR